MNRTNPFDDLSDFTPERKIKPVEPMAIERIAQDNDFPSRQPIVLLRIENYPEISRSAR